MLMISELQEKPLASWRGQERYGNELLNCSLSSLKVQVVHGQNAGCAVTGTNDIPLNYLLNPCSTICVLSLHGFIHNINLMSIVW